MGKMPSQLREIGLGRPLVVAAGSKAGRSAGSPGSPVPLSAFYTSDPVVHASSNAHDLFLGFASVKAEHRLPSLREAFPIKAAHL